MQTTPPPTMPSSSTAAPEVDASIWHAVAGASVRVPAVNSYIYYFPQGHLEQSSPSAAAASYNFTLMRPWIPCQVISVHFLSGPASDQVFARILLQPLQPLGPRQRIVGDGGFGDNDDVVSFAKILTRSDANNGGGFSVPRFCADMILPQLNFEADPPVQTLVLRDTHNNAWEFRHIYRGTPRRHLLTTGWSKFVNAKRLVAGDSVVFMKKRSTSELFVGIRRAERFGGDGSADVAEAVAAIETAVRGVPFEVVYYPKVGSPDFVVMAEKVKDSLRMRWRDGMKVRMAVETDDASRLTWIQGVVTAASTPINGIWCGSPWRMLQVNWDDPEGSHNINVNKVSPWQVEYIPLSPLIDPDFHRAKRFKFLQDSGMIPTEDKRLYPLPPTTELTGNPNSALVFNFSQYPGGMQGARRDHMAAAGRFQLQPAMNNLQPAMNNLQQAMNSLQPAINNLQPAINNLQPAMNEADQELISVSTVLSIGSSYSDIVSPVSQNSVQSPPAQRPGKAVTSFQLFGKTIQTSGGNGGGGADCNESCTCAGEGCDRCT